MGKKFFDGSSHDILMHTISICQYIPVVELVVVDKLHLAVAEAEDRQDMLDREGVEHLDRQVVVAHQAAEVEPRLPAVGAEKVDL